MDYMAGEPHDYKDPDWANAGRVHEWKNYASNMLQQIWPSFSDEQKSVIATSLQEAADRENWD